MRFTTLGFGRFPTKDKIFDKMRPLLTFLILCTCSFALAAQYLPLDRQGYADSLQHLLNSNKATDSTKARAAFQLSSVWNKVDTVKARTYLEKGKTLADGSPFMQALYTYYTGQFYFKSAPAHSEKAYLKTDSILKESELTTISAYELWLSAWANYSILQQIKGDDEQVIDIMLRKVIPYARLGNLHEYVASAYSSVGVLFSNQLEFQKAAEYHEKAVHIIDSISAMPSARVEIYLEAASNYITLEDLNKAKQLQEKSKGLLEDFKKSSPYLSYIANEAMYYRKLKQYDQSLKFIRKGLLLAEHLGDEVLKESLSYDQSKTFFEQGNYQKAKDAMLDVVHHINYPSPGNKKLYYSLLAEIYFKLDNDKEAYRWQKAYSDISDSLSESHLKEKIHFMETRFRALENQKEIATLKVEKTLTQLESNKNRYFIWMLAGTSFILLLLAVFFIIYYINYRRLSVQKEINYQHKLKEIEQHQQLAVTKAMLDGEERERGRLARDLHDGLGGMLAGVKMNLSGWAARYLPSSGDTAFHKVISQLDTSVTEVRRIAHNMMPETLLKFGLKTALQELCDFYSRDDVQVDFQAFGIKESMAITLQTNIYRIVQELLSNALRHSGANYIVVQCSQNGNYFFITVEDNGCGFDSETPHKKKGMGFENLRKRVDYLQATLGITSAPGEGTSVHIEWHCANS